MKWLFLTILLISKPIYAIPVMSLISLLVKVAARPELRQILQKQSVLPTSIVVDLLIQCQGQAYRLLRQHIPIKRHCAANYKRYYLYMDRGRFNNQTKLAVGHTRRGISIYRSISTALNVRITSLREPYKAKA